jgi:hypothetical protein
LSSVPPNQDAQSLDVSDLVGTWYAFRDDGSKFELRLLDDETFTWDFSRHDKSKTMAGTFSTDDDLLILKNENGGAMPGVVTWQRNDRFSFKLPGGPAEDEGLLFSR